MSRVNHVFFSAVFLCGLAALTSGCGGGDSSNSSSSSSSSKPSGSSSTSSSSSSSSAASSDVELGPAAEGGWGTLVVKFQYGGDAPEQPLINVTKDVQYCGPLEPREDQLVVNPDDKGIANIFMWLTLKGTDPAPPVFEGYEETAETPLKLDNFECQFAPHAIFKRSSQPLIIGNSDDVAHNSMGKAASNTDFNVTIAPHTEVTIDPPLSRPERVPFPVTCSIHPWMISHMLVQDHPYVGVSDDSGEIRIENVPAGNWKFTAWHEVPGYVTKVSQDGTDEEWKRGQVTVTIEDGEETSLGALVIPAEIFD